jgi:threonine aldolase
MSETMRIVDLRSDSITQPTPAMRRAMAEAVVGDDGREGDPTAQRLEAMAAELMGQEAGLFVTSGTMGNLVALLTHVKPGEEIIAEREAHVLRFEAGHLAAIVGAIPRTLPGTAGRMDLEQLAQEIQPGSRFRPRTALIEVENTHNTAGGTILDVSYMMQLCDLALSHHVPVHMDGERVFNAAVALGVPAQELTAKCDSVMFGLSKGLGAPYGSMLCGSREFVDRARARRHRVGGNVRQIGHLAAAGIVALETMIPRLAEDHANARRLAEGIAAVRPDLINLEAVQTNIVMLQTGRLGKPATEVAAKLTSAGVHCLPIDRQVVRFVTHCDISADDIEYALGVITESI